MNTSRGLYFLAFALAALLAGCRSDASDSGDGATGDTQPAPPPAPPAVTDPGTGGSGGTAGSFAVTTSVGGIARTYRLYVPTSAMNAMSAGPIPLVMAFHGAGDTGANFIAATALTSAASANGFILAGPDAYPGGGGVRAWFLRAAEGWPGADGTSSSLGNDVGLALKIRQEVGGSYNVDTRRLFACGFSRGAAFTGILATTSNHPGAFSGSYSSPFAAYGICSGYDPFGGTLDLSAASPKRPVWLIHGTSDAAVPYSSGSSYAAALASAGWPATFTPVTGAPHAWLWSPTYGSSNQSLVDFFGANPIP